MQAQPNYSWGRAAVAGHRHEKAYVMPPVWEVDAYDFWEEFTESAARSVIDDELARAPAAMRAHKRAQLWRLKREWFAVERRNHVLTKGA